MTFSHFKTRRQPCVIWPARPNQDEQHIIHGTVGRAQRNAALTSSFGARYHVHETQVRTVWGWACRLLFGVH